MKKVFFTAMILVLLLCTMMNLAAATPAKDTLYIGDTEVIFEEGSSLTEAQKQRIAELLVNGTAGEPTVEPQNILCSMFGHKYTSQKVWTIEHCVNATAPRCKRDTIEVALCSRCNDQKQTLLASDMIYCCP